MGRSSLRFWSRAADPDSRSFSQVFNSARPETCFAVLERQQQQRKQLEDLQNLRVVGRRGCVFENFLPQQISCFVVFAEELQEFVQERRRE